MAAKEGIDRAHSHRASTGGGSEFFICFTARLSSTSRAHSSKSLMSPGRTAPSLSASLSRRLRSGSVKGAQSPMFPGGGGGRRRAFEAAEPSSPKVTCIGQVRVKAKKKNVVSVGVGTPVARTRSQREASFRREPEERECLPNRNQSWVYQLPMSICESLRAIGSEVNCFVPCKGGRSPCSYSRTSPSKVKRRSRSTSSCGAVFARWLMAIDEEGEEGERGEVMDLVVEGREKGEVGFLVREKEVEIIGLDQLSSGEVDRKAEVVVVEEEGRVSVCIPPRNALLLMRCRSDPARVAALADRFWGSPAAAKDPVLDSREEDGNAAQDHKEEEEEGHVPDLDVEFEAEAEKEDETEESVILPSAHEEKEVAMQEEEATCILSEENVGVAESNTCVEPEAAAAAGEGEEFEEIEKGRRSRSCSSSSKPGGRRRSCSSRDKERRRHSFSSEQEARRKSLEKDGRRASFSDGRRRRSFSLEKDELAAKPAVAVAEEHQNKYVVRNQAAETGVEASKPILVAEEIAIRADEGERKMVEERAKDRDQLPDCLLQMMYEPKLSMEVSKETWVCSDDFLRWRPHRAAVKPVVGDSDNAVGDSEGCGEQKGEVALEAEEGAEAELPDQPPLPPPVLQPSTPLPTLIVATERKGVSSSVVVATAAAYGVPLVLTRCNSEPVRSSARLAPDVGFWKSRHQPIGAAEVGF